MQKVCAKNNKDEDNSFDNVLKKKILYTRIQENLKKAEECIGQKLLKKQILIEGGKIYIIMKIRFLQNFRQYLKAEGCWISLYNNENDSS